MAMMAATEVAAPEAAAVEVIMVTTLTAVESNMVMIRQQRREKTVAIGKILLEILRPQQRPPEAVLVDMVVLALGVLQT